MDIELLVVPDCPHATAAIAVAEEAAKQAGVGDGLVTITLINSDNEARARGFVGSPSFLINGMDPFAAPGAPTGLTCRVCSTKDGLSGVPELDQMREVLLRACIARSTAMGGR